MHTFRVHDPLDEPGLQKSTKGDTTSVSGTLDSDFLEGRVLGADHITLVDADDDSSRIAMPSVTA